VISGFRREVDENCALLGHYAKISVNFMFMGPSIVNQCQ